MARTYFTFSEEEIAIIKRYYPDYGSEGVLKMMQIKNLPKRTKASIQSLCIRLGIKSKSGGRFQKGNVPANKGKKTPEKTLEKIGKTWFKPGEGGARTMQVGSLRKSSDNYWYEKIGMPSVWKTKHTLLWEQENGAIPKGCIVRFKDGNTNNIVIENLECITRKEHIIRNMNLEKRTERQKEIWKAKKETRHRIMLREKYGSIVNALSAGERLF